MLGMMIVQTGRDYDADIDTLLANGFTEFRELPSYQTWQWVNASKAALLRNIPKGAKYIWGVSSNRFDNPDYVITPANWDKFRKAILSAAKWAEDNGVYEFQIGNEEEWHVEPYPVSSRPQRVAWVIGKMRAVATEAKQIFTRGNVSYTCAHSYINNWISEGKGDIDILASNVYMEYGTEPDKPWKTEIDKLVNAFGEDTYLTEFAISSATPETYSTDEDIQAKATKEMIDYIKASGMKRAVYFVWYHDYFGGVVKKDGSYRKLWEELQKAKITNTVHGIDFIRIGECNRCGQCCIDDKCPHFEVIDKVATCKIYDTRDQNCEECCKRLGKKYYDHSVCIEFPNHPWLNVIKKDQCSYTFTEIKTDGVSIKDKLDAEWVK